MNWTGKALAEDLQDNLIRSGKMAWVEMPLGSSTRSTGIGRADVLAVTKSYNMRVAVYEVKVRVEDFRNDVKTGKYLAYFKNAHQVVFACPANVIRTEDLPPRVGLTWRHENQWRTQKAATLNKIPEASSELVMALLMRTWDQKTKPSQVEQSEYKSLRQAAMRYGRKFALDIARGQELMAEAHRQRQSLAEVLKLDPNTDLESMIYHLSGEVTRLLRQRAFAGAAVRLSGLVERLFKGDPLYGQNVPRDLRQIAEDVDRELKGERPWTW